MQVADAMVGLIGRVFTYANRTSRGHIQIDLESLNDQQQRNLDLLADLIDRSTDENEIFAHYLISSEDQARMAILLGV